MTCKVFKTALKKQYETKDIQNTIKFFIVLAIHCWTLGLPLRMFCNPRETVLKRTNFSFVSGFQLEIDSGTR